MISYLNQIEQWGRKHPLGFSFLIVTALMLASVLAFKPAYPVNDDPIMSMIVAGKGVTLEPDEHLIFTNIVIGLALKNLHRLAADVPWYGVYLFAVHFISHVALLYSVLTWRFAKRYVGLYLVFYGSVGLYLVCNPQFTTTAFLAAQAGMVLCLTALCRRTEAGDAKIWGSVAAGSLLLVLSSLVRIESFCATVAVAAPIVAALVFANRRAAVLRPAMMAAMAVLLATVGLRWFNTAYYESDPAWAGVYEYNRLLATFSDYRWSAYNGETKHIFDLVGWNESDHAMLSRWFFSDPEKYTSEKLRQVSESFPAPSSVQVAANLRAMVAEMAGDTHLWTLLLILPFMLCCANSLRLTLLATFAAAAAAIALCVALSLLMKSPPQRVYYPLLMFPVTLLLLTSRFGAWRTADAVVESNKASSACNVIRPRGLRAQPAWAIVSVACAGLMLFGTVARAQDLRRQGRISRDASTRAAAALREMNPTKEKLFICWDWMFPIETVRPLARPSSLGDLRMVVLGWSLQTPIHRKMAAAFGVRDLAKELVTRSDLFLIGHESLDPVYQRYLDENFQAALKLQPTSPPGHFSVLQVKPAMAGVADVAADAKPVISASRSATDRR